MCFFGLDHFIPVLLVFVVLDSVYSVPSQQIGWYTNVIDVTYSVQSNLLTHS